MAKFVGQSLKRTEDLRLIQGLAHYVDDIKLPDALHAVFLRSIYAHARIKNIDTSAAEKLPGVVAVYTGKDISHKVGPVPCGASIPDMRVPDHRVLATNKVYWVGHPLAVVIAENRYIGRDAVDVIQVEYDELPPVLDEEKAADSKSPLIHDKIGSNVAYKMSAGEGDIEGALKSADKIVQQKILHKRLCADRPGTPWRAGSLLSRRTADGLRRGLFRHVNRSVTAPSSSRRLARSKTILLDETTQAATWPGS